MLWYFSEPSPSTWNLIDSSHLDLSPMEKTVTKLKCQQKSDTNQTSAQVLLIRSLPNVRWLFQLQLFFLLSACTSSGIGCFVCSSFNKSNPECEDTFNSTVAHPSVGTVNNFQFPCWAFRQGRKGLFPADHCVKVSGYQLDNPSQTIVIRTCALDSGSLTADTEIVRISHCGSFKYEGHQYSGCVQSCSTDGCNDSLRPKSTNFVYLIGSLLLIGRFLFNIW